MSLLLAAVLIGGLTIEPYDARAYSQSVTDCDRLAAYEPDDARIAPGVAHERMDVPRALEACQAALGADPHNPRLMYQLARVQGYSGDPQGAKASRLAAARAGYPSALFVIGYQMAFPPADPSGKTSASVAAERCNGAELLRYSARAGAYAAQVGFTAAVLDGSLDSCVTAGDRNELRSFLEHAARPGQSYYEKLLVQSLQRELTLWSGKNAVVGPADKQRRK